MAVESIGKTIISRKCNGWEEYGVCVLAYLGTGRLLPLVSQNFASTLKPVHLCSFCILK